MSYSSYSTFSELSFHQLIKMNNLMSYFMYFITFTHQYAFNNETSQELFVSLYHKYFYFINLITDTYSLYIHIFYTFHYYFSVTVVIIIMTCPNIDNRDILNIIIIFLLSLNVI